MATSEKKAVVPKKTASTKAMSAKTSKPRIESVVVADRFDSAYDATPIFCDTLADFADDWTVDDAGIRSTVLAQLWSCGGGDN